MSLQNELELYYGSPLSTISDCLRAFLISSPNRDFICADFAQIEARVLAWLAGEEKVLEVFRKGGKIYEHAASLIYQCDIADVTKAQRQIGKVAVLALGYQGGAQAFQKMGLAYGIDVPELEANKIKTSWRIRHPHIVAYWARLQQAAWSAVQKPGHVFIAGAKGREVKLKFASGHLWMRLPSNRTLCYPFAKIGYMPPPYQTTKLYLTYKGKKLNKWSKLSTYGGKLCENATQAVARDLLADAMLRLEDKGYFVSMHVHDEIVCEMRENEGSVSEMVSIMKEIPDWAEGLPVEAEGWRAKRYRK